MTSQVQSFLLPGRLAERVRDRHRPQGRVHSDPGVTLHGFSRRMPRNRLAWASQCPQSRLQCRGMAGLTEPVAKRGAADSFWTWRETMYRFAEARSDETDIEAYRRLGLRGDAGSRLAYASVNLDYVHHDRGGRRFSNPAEMAAGIAAAAEQAGIGLTLLPAFYAHSGFAGPRLDPPSIPLPQ